MPHEHHNGQKTGCVKPFFFLFSLESQQPYLYLAFLLGFPSVRCHTLCSYSLPLPGGSIVRMLARPPSIQSSPLCELLEGSPLFPLPRCPSTPELLATATAQQPTQPTSTMTQERARALLPCDHNSVTAISCESRESSFKAAHRVVEVAMSCQLVTQFKVKRGPDTKKKSCVFVHCVVCFDWSKLGAFVESVQLCADCS